MSDSWLTGGSVQNKGTSARIRGEHVDPRKDDGPGKWEG